MHSRWCSPRCIYTSSLTNSSSPNFFTELGLTVTVVAKANLPRQGERVFRLLFTTNYALLISYRDENGGPFDLAFDLPVLMVSHPSWNFGNGDQVICSTEDFLLVVVGRCKILTWLDIIVIDWCHRLCRISAHFCGLTYRYDFFHQQHYPNSIWLPMSLVVAKETRLMLVCQFPRR